MPAFDGQAIDGYMQVVNKTGNKFVHKLHDYAAKGEMFDIQQLVRKCTLDIMCGKWEGGKL